jgi:hypothetical protein
MNPPAVRQFGSAKRSAQEQQAFNIFQPDVGVLSLQYQITNS